MNLKQGQEVRDAADPTRIGIVVGTGSSLGARVLWCWDESLTWTSERPVVVAPRTAEDVLNNPEPGDQVEWSDGDLWTVSEIAFDVFGLSRVILDVSTGGDLTVGAATWRSLDDAPPMPFTFVPHPPADAQPPTT